MRRNTANRILSLALCATLGALAGYYGAGRNKTLRDWGEFDGLADAGNEPGSLLTSRAMRSLFAQNESAAPELNIGATSKTDGTKAEIAARQRTVAQNLIGQMRDVHFNHLVYNAQMSAFSWTNYLESLDYGRIYFTKSDIEEFEPYKYKMRELAVSGDLTFAKTVFDRLHRRVREGIVFLEENYGTNAPPIVAPDYPPGSMFLWRRKNAAGYSADGEEYEEVWRQIAANSLITALVNGTIQNDKNAAKTNQYDTAEQHSATDAVATNAVASASSTNAPPTIKTESEILADAAADLIKSYRQYLTVLDDGANDTDFYVNKFLNSITAAYDPHSGYMSPENFEDFNIEMGLSFFGIGATLRSEEGAARIMEILPGSPAALDESENRLVTGDKIIGVAQGDEPFEDIRHWPLNKAVRRIRGPKGSVVRLQVIPASDINALKTVVIIRDEIKLEEQAASKRLETVTDADGVKRKLGYIRLPSFYASMKVRTGSGEAQRRASADIAAHIADLNAENVEGLILDLRGNGGGSLPEAIYTTGLFIKTGPVVQVKELRGTMPLPDNDPSVAFNKPLIVMIDRHSASASEIVAGALQDYGRALIVGDSSSHGKGTVQTLLPLQNGRLGSLKATTSAFYRINGSSTQIKGVASDIILPSVYSRYNEIGEDKLPNALPWTQIKPERYRKIDDLSGVVPALSSNSAVRVAANDKWRKYSENLDRISANLTNDFISLNIAERLEKARENEVFNKEHSFGNDGPDEEPLSPDIPSNLGTDEYDDGDDASNSDTSSKQKRDELRRKNDIVLDETLMILLDLIDLHGSPLNLEGEHTAFDYFMDFFR